MNKNLVTFRPVAEVRIDKELLEKPQLLKWLKDIPKSSPLCYLVCGGFYTYYLTPQLYQTAIEEGLVEAPQETLPVRSYLSMLQHLGMLTNMRVNWALHHVTLDDLRKAVHRMNSEPACYEIHVYQERDKQVCTDPVPDRRLLADLSAGTVKTLAANDNSPYFHEVTDHISLLETLADTLGCQFMSGHHLREEFEQRGNTVHHNLGGIPSTPECTVRFLPLL